MKLSISLFAFTLALAVFRPLVLAFKPSNAGIRQRNVALRRQRAFMTQVREAAQSSIDITTTKVFLHARTLGHLHYVSGLYYVFRKHRVF